MLARFSGERHRAVYSCLPVSPVLPVVLVLCARIDPRQVHRLTKLIRNRILVGE